MRRQVSFGRLLPGAMGWAARTGTIAPPLRTGEAWLCGAAATWSEVSAAHPSTGSYVRPKSPRPWLLPSRPHVSRKASARPLELRAPDVQIYSSRTKAESLVGVNISPGANCPPQGGLQPLVSRKGATDVQPLQGVRLGTALRELGVSPLAWRTVALPYTPSTLKMLRG